MDGLTPSSLVETLNTLEDPRGNRTRLHNLTDILELSVLTVICGADNFVAIRKRIAHNPATELVPQSEHCQQTAGDSLEQGLLMLADWPQVKARLDAIALPDEALGQPTGHVLR